MQLKSDEIITVIFNSKLHNPFHIIFNLKLKIIFIIGSAVDLNKFQIS